MARPVAGQIVLVDWRGGRLDGEPGGLRPAVVVEAEGLLSEGYPTMLVVPLTRDERFATLRSLVVQIDPTDRNGVPERCFALAHHITSVSLARCRHTPSVVTEEQLAAIRRRIRVAIDHPADA